MDSGRVAVVTGAAAGIGFAITGRLSDEGVAVHAIDRDAARLEGSWSRNAAVTTHAANLDSFTEVETLCAELAMSLDRLDYLVNNAGITPRVGLVDTDESVWRVCLDTNLAAPAMLTRGFRDALIRAHGSVVNVSSIHAHATAPLLATYAASKAGVEGLTRALAVELGPDGVRVNAVAPGYVDTGYVATYPDGAAERIRLQHPLRRLGAPNDVAEVVLFLLGDAARFVTGAVVPVDGGLSARLAALSTD